LDIKHCEAISASTNRELPPDCRPQF
jgi:hypothetical protein